MLIKPQRTDFAKQAMITFSYDDGYKNNYIIAAPLHEEYNIPATFNIVTNWVINNNRYSPIMTVADILDLAERGFEIASHSVTHGIDAEKYPEVYPNGKLFKDMTDNQAEWELSESKQQLLNWGLSVSGFVLPYSSHANNKSLYLPYEYVRGGRNALETYPPSDRYDIPCYFVVDKNKTPSQLKSAIDQAIAEKKWMIVMMHHVIDDLGDTDVTNNSTYYWYENQLEEVLQYIASKPKSQILPVDTISGYSFAQPIKSEIMKLLTDSYAKYNGNVRKIIGQWAKVNDNIQEGTVILKE